MDALQKSSAALRKWCVEQALPTWGARAQRPDKSWVEHLHLDGTADLAAERRWRVLARQVYVYAKASALDWFDGRDIAVSTYEKMKSVGYVHRVSAEGQITNAMRDLYDDAFYILAASSLYGLTRQLSYLDDAEALLSWLDTELAHPSGGWKESNNANDTSSRRQNPHMHLFEASLNLYTTTQNPKHLSYANRIYQLFRTHFYDNGTVTEFFDSNWNIEKDDTGQTVEPGHAVEWVWLLGQYAKLTTQDVRRYQSELYSKTLRNRGWFLNDEENKNGDIRRSTKRLWVQTEVVKAHLAMAECNTTGSREMAAATIDALFSTYLRSDGTWNDQIDRNGQNIAKTIPTSTFYHILCMATESERIATIV